MKWSDELANIRYYLSDPKGDVWQEGSLRERFNSSILDLLGALPTTRAVATISVPPGWQSSHTYDWESAYSEGSRPCLRDQGGVFAFCASFEVQVLVGHASDSVDDGEVFTHPFEAWLTSTPGIPVPFQFPADFHEAQSLFYDEEPISYDSRKFIQFSDPSWVKRTGEPVSYWRADAASNEFYLYPLPSTIVWNDTTQGADVAFASSAAFEADEIPSTESTRRFTRETSTLAHVWDWEKEAPFHGSDPFLRGMWLFENGFRSDNLHGQVLFKEGDTVDSEFGTIRFRESTSLSSETGVDIGLIEAVDNCVLVYSKAPIAMRGPDDDVPLPDYMVRYARFRTLSWAYSMKTDFQNQSLSQYWNTRYQLGLLALKQFSGSRQQDRNLRLITNPDQPTARRRRGPRLPDSYPAT